MADCCHEYTRAQLVREAGIARAGRGLPAVERGMPLPAGTGLTRRRFVVRAAGTALAVYGATRLGLPSFEEGIAQAAAETGSGPVLVSVFMPGGADSLSVLAPVGDPRYAQLRPTLGLRDGTGSSFSGDDRLRWHPGAQGLATLYGEGKVSVFPAIGYANADQSHFTSRHFWEVGATDAQLRLGWLGRYLDQVGSSTNPLQGLSLNSSLSPALAPARVPVSALDSPAAYTFASPGVDDPALTPMLDAITGLGMVRTSALEPQLRQARDVAAAAGRLRGELVGFASADGSPVYNSAAGFPKSDLGARLAGVSAMLARGLPMRAVTVEADDGDFDTHSDQAQTFGPRLATVTDTILAFQRDLEARGLADRVVTLLWSEFGRRPQENGSGTDHGAAGAAFVIGTRVRGGLLAEFPGLGTLDDNDNLVATSDFRGLYSGLLEQWLGHDAGRVIPGADGFGRPALIR
jgi:uncharacterized protein (DUF1501 family)